LQLVVQLQMFWGRAGAMIKRALTNTGWLMGARGVNAVLSLAYLALATRSLGLEGFGQFILDVTFAQALVGFVSFQSWQVVVRWGQTKDSLGDATGFALALDALSMVAGAIAAALVLWLAGSWLPLPPELRLAAYGYTLVLLLTLRSTPTGILRLHDRYARAATADSVTSIVRGSKTSGVLNITTFPASNPVKSRVITGSIFTPVIVASGPAAFRPRLLCCTAVSNANAAVRATASESAFSTSQSTLI
jgi:O-antigen/teichoic acid export membrane protein